MERGNIIAIAVKIQEELRAINTAHNKIYLDKIEKIRGEFIHNNYEVFVVLDSLKTSKHAQHMIHGFNSCIEHYLNTNHKLYKACKLKLRVTPTRIKLEELVKKYKGNEKAIIKLLTT